MTASSIAAVFPLGPPPWPCWDPFLFCVHHRDDYPPGTEELAVPPRLLSGRHLGMDFSGDDGFSMYHGRSVPGFPQHPHRGFETVTLARRGFIDHSDSLGATARFGHGDAQWMTAGSGIVHAEMFPLVHRDAGNPAELFQLWLNLPRARKMVPASFTMLWEPQIPTTEHSDQAGKKTRVTNVAGQYQQATPAAPPSDSWAAEEHAEVAIWTVQMEAGARWVCPAGSVGLNRTLYFFEGDSLTVDGTTIKSQHGVRVHSNAACEIVNGESAAELLLLQGRPIGEPVVQHGPFVMNEPAEIQQAMLDYQRTGFGGWPWPHDAPVHPRETGRFARHPNGREERPTDPHHSDG